MVGLLVNFPHHHLAYEEGVRLVHSDGPRAAWLTQLSFINGTLRPFNPPFLTNWHIINMRRDLIKILMMTGQSSAVALKIRSPYFLTAEEGVCPSSKPTSVGLTLLCPVVISQPGRFYSRPYFSLNLATHFPAGHVVTHRRSLPVTTLRFMRSIITNSRWWNNEK